MYKYTYRNKILDLCGICYANVEQYLLGEGDKINLIFSKIGIKKLQKKNEEINEKIKKLDLTIFPRSFLEDFIDFIRENEFTSFKRYLKNYEIVNKIKIPNIDLNFDKKNQTLNKYIKDD